MYNNGWYKRLVVQSPLICTCSTHTADVCIVGAQAQVNWPPSVCTCSGWRWCLLTFLMHWCSCHLPWQYTCQRLGEMVHVNYGALFGLEHMSTHSTQKCCTSLRWMEGLACQTMYFISDKSPRPLILLTFADLTYQHRSKVLNTELNC